LQVPEQTERDVSGPNATRIGFWRVDVILLTEWFSGSHHARRAELLLQIGGGLAMEETVLLSALFALG
jgi:hypothetical protein